MSILSIYCAPGHKLNTDYWTSLIRTIKPPLLMCGDLNSYHTSFGCSYDNFEGRNLIDAIDIENLCILNDGTPTLIRRHDRRPSAVDLSVGTPSLIPRMEWRVVDEPFGSDHVGILMSIDKQVQPDHHPPHNSRKWNLKSAQWDKYTLLSDQLLSQMPTSQDPCLNYDHFVACINGAAEICIAKFKPYLGRKPKHPPKPWWDEECDKARKYNIDAFKQYKLSPSLSNFINCKRASTLCRKIYREKRRLKWAEFCNSFNRNTPVKRIWSGVRALRHGYVGRKISSDNWVPEFLNSFSPEIVPNQDQIPYTSFGAHKLNDPFSYNELILALKTNSNTSPGEDNIHYPMLTNLSSNGKKVLLRVLNDVWVQEKRIDAWSNQIVVPLLKPNKDPSLHDSYRPIALSSCIGKTFERLIKARLEWWVEANRKVLQYQNGFRKKHCTLDALAGFVSDIHDCFSDKYMIHLKNVYNTVSISVLIIKWLIWVYHLELSDTLITSSPSAPLKSDITAKHMVLV